MTALERNGNKIGESNWIFGIEMEFVTFMMWTRGNTRRCDTERMEQN